MGLNADAHLRSALRRGWDSAANQRDTARPSSLEVRTWMIGEISPLRSSSRSALPLCYRISSAKFSPMALKSTTRGEETAQARVNAYTRGLNAI
jgi:hypothetical protein